MNGKTLVLGLLLVLLPGAESLATDRVVVVPLNSSQSGGKTVMAFAPNDFILWESPATAPSVSHNRSGSVGFTGTGTGEQGISIPLNIPVQLLGTPLSVSEVTVNYYLKNAGSYITRTLVGTLGGGGVTPFINDLTDQTSTGWNSYTITPVSGTPWPVSAPLDITLIFNFSATTLDHEITLGTIKVTLVK